VYEKVRSFTDDNIIFISISDGEPSGKAYGGQSAIDDMKRIIEKCKRDGFVTIGVGLEYNVKNIYNYHTVVTDNNKLVEQVSTIINKVVKTEFQD
jgi:nitric oxide reductase activation protein